MIDAQLSKTQVLELYLNRIYLSAGVYGVETMSRHLFGKPAKQLTLAESALIAGLAQSPAGLSPWTNLDGAVARSHVVLARMRAAGLHHRRAGRGGEARAAAHPPVSRRSQDARAGYAKEFLRQQFRDEFGGDHPPDWEVRTTFVPGAAGDRRAGGRARACAASAAPSCRPRSSRSIRATGDILALVGGRDFRQSQFNRATRSRRQPGSAFKPLLYAAALEHGFSPVSVLEGLAHIAPQGPEEWSPRNAERRDARRADAARGAARVEQPRRHACCSSSSDRVRC